MSFPRLQPDRRSDPDRDTPERRGLRKGVYLIPSIFTALNLFAGFYSLMSAMNGFRLLGIGGTANVQWAVKNFDYAAMAIGWALLCDILDGRIARMTRSTTEIGIQLDSIADVVSFGLAPAVLAYVWGFGTSLERWSNVHQLAWFLAFMYLICGGFRLARFNVQASRPRLIAEGTPKVDKQSFVGLPIPVAGGMIAAIVHFIPTPIKFWPAHMQLAGVLMMVLVGFLSVLMVSTIRFTSLKSLGTGSRSARIVIGIIALAGLIYLYSRWVLLILVTAYILHGLISRVFTSLRNPA